MDGGGLVELRLLGNFELVWSSCELELPPVAQRLVAFLAVRGQRLSRPAILETLWAVEDERTRGRLRNTLWRIRQLCPPLVSATPASVALEQSVVVDLNQQLQCSRQLARGEQPDTNVAAQLDLLTQELLPSWDEEWLFFERERRRQLRLHALEALSSELSNKHRHGEAIEAALAAVAMEPLRESAQRALAAAYLNEGNYREARRTYDDYAGLLDDELGVRPSAEFRLLMIVP